ncbi:condensation domain-containing protein [Streptomyces sp. TLI_105]|uniref:condensation domain-containing protein n=1 Tax=Streptomyces sp. TLI_105 TaxID=1881019 RepID=UPI00089A898B|nr:condensation domain-containing protein [Streptomyces sp. TLI_105]SEE02211.1 AMP-binding enzyme C-terminal domain-containing protein [Streptomyces sp. TLI_105]
MIPLSYAQRRLWFLNRLEGSSSAYNAPVVLRLGSMPDPAALRAAVRDVVERHEVLRTVYPALDEEPYQKILDDADVRFDVEECGAGEDVTARTTAFARLPVDVTHELPLRARLFKVDDGTAVLVLLVHHIATDGWSVGCLLADLDAAYRARVEGRAPDWEPLPVQYADYALWQRDMLGDPEDPDSTAHEQLAHWRKALDGIPAETRLPADRPRPTEPGHRGAVVSAELDAGAHRSLASLARSRRGTFFLVARAALALALRAAGAGEDVVVGTPVAGRPEEDLHDLVGFFVNTLALRTDLSGDPALGALVDRVRETDLIAFAHEDLPFDLLVEDLNPERSLGRHPFFQVMLSAQVRQGDETVRLGTVPAVLDDADLATAKFDLSFHCQETLDSRGEPGGVLLGLQYATDLYDEDTARLLLALFRRALTAFAEERDSTPLSRVELLSDGEQDALDRRHLALAEAARTRTTTRQERAGSRSVTDPREEILNGLFAEILDRDDVRPGDNFFKLGGHSLLAGKLTNRIRGALGLQAAIRDVFLAPTPRQLLRRLGARGDGPRRPALRPVSDGRRPDPVPLSYAQRRLWFLGRLEGPSSAYNAPMVLTLDAHPETTVLEAAVRDVTRRHEVLRTIYPVRDGEPYQLILDAPEVRVEVEECATPEDAQARATDFAGIPLDVTRELPIRAKLFAVADGTAVLVLSVHHIATDGWSVGALLADLDTAYRARVEGRAPEWEPLPVQYTDYTLWQRELLDGEHGLRDGQSAYWRKALDGVPAETRLPADRSRPTEPSHRGAVVTAELDALAHKALAGVARGRRVTFFMVVRAALALALRAAGAGEDVVVGTAVAGRPEQDLHDLVGFFVNTLALRTDLSGDPTLAELVRRVRDGDLAAFAHDDLPFDLLVEDLNPERSLGRHPFFQVMVSAQTTRDTTVRLGGITGVTDGADLAGAKFDLAFHCAETHDTGGEPGGVLLGLQYATDLYDEDTARLLLSLFRRALTAFAERAGDTPLSGIDLLTDEERRGLDRRHESLALAHAERTRATSGDGRGTGTRAVTDPREEILRGLFAEVLDRDEVLPDDNFFKLGGHSLLAGKLTNRIRGALGLQAAIRDVFLAPTPRQLLRRLAERGDGPARPPLRAVPDALRPARVPLSAAQLRLWFLNRLEGPSATYDIPVVTRLHRPVEPAVLAAALADVADRHEVLRTVYRTADGEPYQQVLAGVTPVLDEVAAAGPDELRAAVDAAAGHVFDLAAEIPFRASLVTDGDGGQIMVLLVHHIAGDGWSTGCLLGDLDRAYRARAEGRAPEWEPLPVQYTDYTLWQHDLLDGEHGVAGEQLAHWREALDGLPPLLALPTDRSRPAESDGAGALTAFEVDAATHRALLRVARSSGATLFMVVQAALAALLTRHGAGTDLAIGTTVAGRADDALHPLVGFFVNTLVLRTDTSGDPDFTELVRRVRESGLAAYSHQDLPFDRLVEHLSPHRSAAHAPLVQVMLQVHAAATGSGTPSVLDGDPVAFSAAGAKSDLTFALTELVDADGRPAGLRGALEYATALYDADTAALLARRLVETLDALAADPCTALSGAPYGPAAPAGPEVVLDERGRPAPVRVPGEVHERTPGGGLRATGRRAYAEADGSLRPVATLTAGGYPVEPGRVEDVLGGHPHVTGAAVAVRDDRLYAYVTRLPGGADEATLRRWAAERLPEYLAPARVVVVPRLPAPGAHADVLPETPRSAAGPDGREERLLGIFRDVLGGRPLGRDDNFFKSGGHSLLAVRLLNRIRAEFGQDLTLRDVFRNPTAATLADRLTGAAAPTDRPAPAAPAAPALRRRTAAGSRRPD